MKNSKTSQKYSQFNQYRNTPQFELDLLVLEDMIRIGLTPSNYPVSNDEADALDDLAWNLEEGNLRWANNILFDISIDNPVLYKAIPIGLKALLNIE